MEPYEFEPTGLIPDSASGSSSDKDVRRGRVEGE